MATLVAFLQEYGGQIVEKSGEHLEIALIALAIGIVIAVPLGILLTRLPRVSGPIISLVSMLQTIPSLAILALMVPLFGVGKIPAIIALAIYSLLPILRNTYIGMKGVDPNMVDAAKGMGMTTLQSIVKVEIPASMGAIMAGIRLSAVYVIAWTTLSSYVGAGGLGDLIFSGLNLYKPLLIIGGTIPIMLIALIIDFLLGKLEHRLTPLPYREVEAS